MAGKLMGLKKAEDSLRAIVDEVSGTRITRAITAAGIIISTESASMTPIATSTLINSQYRTIEINGTRITSKIGYSAKYAAFVHNAPGTLLGKSVNRSPASLGKVWGPSGNPKFLDKAVDNTRSMVDAAIMREMRL